MLTGIDVTETTDFSVAADDGEVKTVFVVKTLTERERFGLLDKYGDVQDLSDQLNSETEHAAKIVARIRPLLEDICNAGLVAVKNIKLGDTVHDELTDVNAAIAVLDTGVLSEVSSAIVKNNFLNDDDEKN